MRRCDRYSRGGRIDMWSLLGTVSLMHIPHASQEFLASRSLVSDSCDSKDAAFP